MSRELHRDVFSVPEGIVGDPASHRDEGSARLAGPGLDEVHPRRVRDEVDPNLGDDFMIESRGDLEALLDAGGGGGSNMLGPHSGVCCSVVELAGERDEGGGIRTPGHAHQVLERRSRDQDRLRRKYAHVREINAVDRLAADRAISCRPGLRRRSQHDRLVVQQRLQWRLFCCFDRRLGN